MRDLRGDCIRALGTIACCQPASVGDLGLAPDVEVEGSTAHVRVIPCCVFGMTRLVTAVEDGLRLVDGIDKVHVEVAWDISRMSPLVKIDLDGWAAQAGLTPWGAKEIRG